MPADANNGTQPSGTQPSGAGTKATTTATVQMTSTATASTTAAAASTSAGSQGAAKSQDKATDKAADKAAEAVKGASVHKAAEAIKIPPRYAKILNELGVAETLKYVSERREILAPYEMRQAVNPQVTSSMAEQYWTRHVPGIEGMRNVLVVLPLTITWLTLGLAALAYDQSLPKLKNTIPPDFFQLWQQGFPGLVTITFGQWTIPLVVHGVRYLTFTDVALLDVCILLLMLILTAFTQFTVGDAVRRSRNLEVWLSQQLHVMSIKSVVWSLSPSEQQPRWAAEVQTAINSLNGALESVTSSVTSFKQEIVDQGEAVRKAVAQTGAVPVAVNDLIKVYQQAIEAQNLLQTALPTIQTNLQTVADSQYVTAADWTRMTEELGLAIMSIRRLADMMGGTDDLERAAEQIHFRYSEALRGTRASRPLNRIGEALRRLWPFTSRN